MVEVTDMPLMFDLYCGLGGATEGFLAEGWQCIGIDNERHDYGSGGYPAQLWIQDILTVHGSQLRYADFIWASPPCQKYSWLAMPWSRSKSNNSQAAKALRREWETNGPDNRLFDACFRIQREAIEASTCRDCNGAKWGTGADHECPACRGTGKRYIPLVVENVRGAKEWVGIPPSWNYGSFYLWGDVPALMPVGTIRKLGGADTHTWEKFGVSGTNWSTAAINRTLPRSIETKNGGDRFGSGVDCSLQRKFSSKGLDRKAASAQIAKIPLPLSRHIARTYYPQVAV